MSDLISRLRKVLGDMECPWDDDVTRDNAFYSKHELRPLLDALLELAMAAKEHVECEPGMYANECVNLGGADGLREALARLEQIAKELGDE